MRELSAIGFIISIIGLLLALFNQLAVIQFLNDLHAAETQSYELTIHMTEKYEMLKSILSILCMIIGIFSVIFCSFVYLRKRTRMTFIGTLIGAVVTIMAIIHSF